MNRANTLKLAALVLFLAFNQKTTCQIMPYPPIVPRPLCMSQFALVNHACAMLPYTPGPPPSPPTPPGPTPPGPTPPDPAPPAHRHRHRHRHGHGRVHTETPVEEACCHWLNQVDDECVCDLLVRLPPFLSRPVHQYTLIVPNSCNVTYQCGSRIAP